MRPTYENPLLRPSELPYGLPDFTAVTPGLLREALEEAMAHESAAWRDLAAQEAPAGVADTVEAVAWAHEGVERATSLLMTYAGSVGTEDYQDLAAEYLPALAAHADDFWLDPRVYRRFLSLDRARPLLNLAPDVQHYVSETVRRFRLRGIELDEPSRAELRDLHMQLASLESDFNRRVTRAGLVGALEVADPAALDGLDEATRAALRAGDGYRLELANTTQQDLAARLGDADVRARLLEASTGRCGQLPVGAEGEPSEPDHVSETDTRATLLEIARLRARRAELLGHPHHASVVAAGNDAGTTDRIDLLLDAIAGPAAAQADAELAALEELGRARGLARVGPGDLTHLYAHRRREVARLDDEELRPYLDLDAVLVDGAFHAAHLLYGLTFLERADLAGYAPGVRVWEVTDADGSGLGLFIGDFHTRPGKQGGAWMHALVDQSRLLGTRPVVCNNLNLRPPADGRPTLLTWDDVRTVFHEFGHALHGLLSDVHLPQQSGTNVERDTVEYPSQVNEMWMTHPEVLPHFARHHATGEPMPAHLLERVRAAEEVSRGFETVEHTAAVLLDQAWHRLAPPDVPVEPREVDAVERAALERAGLAHPLIPPRYRSSYFRHTFGGGYDAGYYSYLWAEQLDADTVEWFTTVARRGDDGGLNRAAGDRFRAEVLSRGGTRPMSASFRALRGREVSPTPLLRRKGLLPDDED